MDRTLSRQLDQVIVAIEAIAALPESSACAEALVRWRRVKTRLEARIDAR